MLEKIKEWWSQGTDWVIKAGIIIIVLLIIFVLLWNYTTWFDWVGQGHHYPQEYPFDRDWTQLP